MAHGTHTHTQTHARTHTWLSMCPDHAYDMKLIVEYQYHHAGIA